MGLLDKVGEPLSKRWGRIMIEVASRRRSASSTVTRRGQTNSTPPASLLEYPSRAFTGQGSRAGASREHESNRSSPSLERSTDERTAAPGNSGASCVPRRLNDGPDLAPQSKAG